VPHTAEITAVNQTKRRKIGNHLNRRHEIALISQTAPSPGQTTTQLVSDHAKSQSSDKAPLESIFDSRIANIEAQA